jgi:hypothetical protein
LIARGRLWNIDGIPIEAIKEDVADISDGLDALRSVMSLREIASLIERTARWVSPDTFRLLPLWFPEHARRGSFYKKNWSEPQMNKNRRIARCMD